VHWVQQRCFESGTQSQCPPFLLLLCGTSERRDIQEDETMKLK